MKKTMIWLLLATYLFAMMGTAHAGQSALEAFEQLTGQPVSTAPLENEGAARATSDEYLAKIMNGAFAARELDAQTAAQFAPALRELTAITAREIAAYAAASGLAEAQVRNAYFRALANVLRAEIMLNPASEERYKNIQVILSLFLNADDGDATRKASREAIRRSMTPEHAQTIATEYALPAAFVEFVIMDDDWDDDDWHNDDDWTAQTGWNWSYEDSADDAGVLALGSRDTADSTSVAALQQRLIALGYLTGKADGIFGPRTEAALREFQLANGLTGSGTCGADTQAKLNAADVVARWNYADSYSDSTDAYDDSADAYGDSYDDSPDQPASTPKPAYDDSYDDSPDQPASTPKPAYDDSPDQPASTPKPAYDDSYDDSPDQPASTPKPAYDDSSDDDDDSDDDYDDSDD